MTQTTFIEAAPAQKIRWSIPVTYRIAIAIIVLVCGGLMLSNALNFVKFEKSLSNLADDHYEFLLQDTHGAIEAGTAIGVPLNALGNVQALLERAKQTEPAIIGIDVADPFGKIIYSSSPERVGSNVPKDWPKNATPHDVWHFDRPGAVTLGQPLVNAFEVPVGLLTLTYSTAYYQQKADGVLHDLMTVAAPLTLAGAVVTLLGCLLVLRRFRISVGRMSDDLETVLSKRPIELDQRPANSGFERQFGNFLQRLAGGMPSDGAAAAADAQEENPRHLLYPTFILAALVILVPLGVLSWVSVDSFKRTLVPEMHAEGAALARAVSKDVSRALDLNIPVSQLVDTEPYLASMLKLMPAAKYIAIADVRGRMLYSGGLDTKEVLQSLRHGRPLQTNTDYSLIETADFVDIALTIPAPDQNPLGRGYIHVGISTDFLKEQTRDIVFNVGVMSLAGLLVTFEILLLVIAIVILHPLGLMRRMLTLCAQGNFALHVRSIAHDELGRLILLTETGVARLRSLLPSDGKAGTDQSAPKEVQAPHLAFMRAPLFLFCFAEEFARSFFPLYTHSLAETIHGVSSSMLASLPITIFMLLVAVGTPLSAVWSDRYGRRPIFLIGAALSTVGLGLSAVALGYWDLLLYRAVSGLGYAMVFIASQGYVLDNTSDRDRTRGMAVYVAAITGADVAGPPIGGIVSDQLGFNNSLLVAACFILISGVLAWMLLHDEKQDRVARRSLRLADIMLLLSNLRFTSLIVCVSMPAKLMLSGFLFYLVPLHLSAVGQTDSIIGRVIMVYAISSIAVTPIAARIADRWGMLQTVVIGGALVAGLAMLALLFSDDIIGMIVAVAGLGIGQAFTIAAQLSLVTRYTADEAEWLGRTTVVSVFRLVERMGGVIGPILAGALLVMLGARVAIVTIGMISVVGALALVGILFVISRREGAST